ncbi:4-(cytidine 5'-diphospho)-2-C-methyl-D-erythritol kinase [bacterium]|nr:4-(cytidine 5'-diphospho)-2-C-methyl-D-erythritol kinase [bacterium]
MTDHLTLFAPAKINLHLDILKRRADGFHDLATVFQALRWGDELKIRTIDGERDELKVTGPFAGDVPHDESNLVLRIVDRARVELNIDQRVSIDLRKKVPVQAGLGGGSSDAAAALIGFAELSGISAEDHRLVDIAAEVGSDCAFFIRGGTQEGWSRGEELAELPLRHEFGIVVVVPKVKISTREAFESLTPGDLGLQSDVDGLKNWLAAPETRFLPDVHNTFLAPLCKRHPEIANALDELKELGAQWSQLSGTGSACFGIFPDLKTAEKAASEYSLPAQILQACEPWLAGVTFHA